MSETWDIYPKINEFEIAFFSYWLKSSMYVIISDLARQTLYNVISPLHDLGKEALWEKLWEKEKMLVTSIFSFSYNIFNHIKKECIIWDTWNCRLQFMSNWTKLKSCRLIIHNVKLPHIGNLRGELSFVTLTIHLCNGLNDKKLFKPRKTCFITV